MSSFLLFIEKSYAHIQEKNFQCWGLKFTKEIYKDNRCNYTENVQMQQKEFWGGMGKDFIENLKKTYFYTYLIWIYFKENSSKPISLETNCFNRKIFRINF